MNEASFSFCVKVVQNKNLKTSIKEEPNAEAQTSTTMEVGMYSDVIHCICNMHR